MVYCIIATVGQSVISNADRAAFEGAKALGRDKTVDLKAICNNQHDFPGKQWYDIVMASLKAKSSDAGLLRAASAELNHLVPTLQGAAPHKSDELHFLASETADGVLAGRILKDFCQAHFQRSAELHIIEGLQVKDGDRFRRLGLSSLISKVFSLLRPADPAVYTRIINPTGGFKGVVPYLTIIGMLEPQVEISYIYEYSSELIRLAGVPLRLDFEQMESAYTALVKCDAKVLNDHDLQRALGWEGRSIAEHPLWSLFDFIDDNGDTYYEPSGLGRIVLEHFKHRQQPKVYLSKAAAERFRGLDKTRKREFEEMFRMLPNPDWRERHHHGVLNGATIIKPGNTDERLYYYLAEEGIVVAELAFHLPNGSYDREPTSKHDYPGFQLWKG